MLHVIKCLKKLRREIKDIKQFMEWSTKDKRTYVKCKDLFEHRRATVKNEITQPEKTFAILEYKCWYYDTAIKDGREKRIATLLPNRLFVGI